MIKAGVTSDFKEIEISKPLTWIISATQGLSLTDFTYAPFAHRPEPNTSPVDTIPEEAPSELPKVMND